VTGIDLLAPLVESTHQVFSGLAVAGQEDPAQPLLALSSQQGPEFSTFLQID